MQSLEESISNSMHRKKRSFLSKDLPQHVVLNILIRLPVKSLIRFKCICKSWYFSITNSNFITNHLNQAKLYNNSNNGYVLYIQNWAVNKGYLLCTDMCNSDGTLSSVSRFVLPCNDFGRVGYCNGLICIALYNNRTIYLWNPSIRKFKMVTGTSLSFNITPSNFSYGFAYHSQKNDYKIARIVGSQWQNVIKADVYTLSTDMWRMVEVSLESFRSFGHYDYMCDALTIQAPFVNGALHWTIQSNHRFWYL